ncbi:MAG: RNA pseudouridine synthase [Treponema sp.]|jgi:23S rRNA pseudouridine1911/1915/1917 synthase|nr:RNA pseudouridine synthase [Treponema sp.]
MTAFWEKAAAEPALLRESERYLLLYKPPRFHTAPLHAVQSGESGTLLEWAAKRYPDILAVTGHRAGEGGLLSRLDYETQGLVLIARTQKLFDDLKGGFIKKYEAFSRGGSAPRGFPPLEKALPVDGGAFSLSSAFRPYGPGRKAVRPVVRVSGGVRVYTTEGAAADKSAGTTGSDGSGGLGGFFFRVTIKRGFRHQIRCHLAWAGYPLLNDSVYGGTPDGGFLALRAGALSFNDGVERIDYTLEP